MVLSLHDKRVYFPSQKKRQDKDETPHFIKQQQNLVREYIVRRFWQRMNEMVASGEMQAAFDRVLGSDQVYEAQILPGEQSALLESSSSGT